MLCVWYSIIIFEWIQKCRQSLDISFLPRFCRSSRTRASPMGAVWTAWKEVPVGNIDFLPKKVVREIRKEKKHPSNVIGCWGRKTAGLGVWCGRMTQWGGVSTKRANCQQRHHILVSSGSCPAVARESENQMAHRAEPQSTRIEYITTRLSTTRRLIRPRATNEGVGEIYTNTQMHTNMRQSLDQWEIIGKEGNEKVCMSNIGKYGLIETKQSESPSSLNGEVDGFLPSNQSSIQHYPRK